MASPPLARIQDLSEEEKQKLSAILKRKLFVRGSIFLSVILVCVIVMLYFNDHNKNSGLGDNIGLVNVVFIVVSVLFARLFVSELLEYRKEIKSPFKKVIQTKVGGRKDNEIILGNKSFSKEEIILDASDFDDLQGGEEVTLEISAKSNTIFSIKKVGK